MVCFRYVSLGCRRWCLVFFGGATGGVGVVYCEGGDVFVDLLRGVFRIVGFDAYSGDGGGDFVFVIMDSFDVVSGNGAAIWFVVGRPGGSVEPTDSGRYLRFLLFGGGDVDRLAKCGGNRREVGDVLPAGDRSYGCRGRGVSGREGYAGFATYFLAGRGASGVDAAAERVVTGNGACSHSRGRAAGGNVCRQVKYWNRLEGRLGGREARDCYGGDGGDGFVAGRVPDCGRGQCVSDVGDC